MKIAFLHSCLEPGRDGVGDYTTALAAECARQGAQTCALAINDPFISAAVEDRAGGPRQLRLPRSASWEERMRRAGDFLDAEKPDWASLQFVSYAYAERGLVFGLARRLAPLFEGRLGHVMFHELWIGQDPGDPLKKRLVGWTQKRLIQGLTRRLRFRSAHTSNSYYLDKLQGAGIAAEVLPLFGSVPILPKPDTNWLVEKARAAGWPLESGGRDRYLLFGFFGSIHPVWPPEPLMTRLCDAGRRLGKKIGVISAGRVGPGAALWEGMARDFADKSDFLRLGETAAGQLAGYFAFLDYGVATTPYALIGKSATVAAMLEHGLPVIVNRDEIPFSGAQAELADSRDLLIKMREDLAETLPARPPRRRPAARLPGVARRFLDSLARARATHA
jgi:hypothetical protein